MPQPVIALDPIELIPRPEAWLPPATVKGRFDASRAPLGEALGLKTLGANVTQVAPGCAAYPFHSHRVNDELFVVLAGQGTLRLGDGHHPVQAGDVIGCPAGGPGTAHQLINTGEVPLRYLAIDSQLDPEVCEYPDSGKVGLFCGKDEATGWMHLSTCAGVVDYWHGE